MILRSYSTVVTLQVSIGVCNVPMRDLDQTYLLTYCHPPDLLTCISLEEREAKLTVPVDATETPDQADLCLMLERDCLS